MRIFIFESVTCGGFLDQREIPQSLVAEGATMLTALAADFGKLPDVTIATLRDRRWQPALPGVESFEVESLAAAQRQFDIEVTTADRCVIIAPETDGELVRWRSRAVQLGGHLLGPDAEWTAQAADKHLTCRLLAATGVPAVEGIALPEGATLPLDFPYPALLKPRDGCGSCGIERIENPTQAEARGPLAFAARYEPLQAGRAASVALLVNGASLVPLAPCWQKIATDGSYAYQGGELIKDTELAHRAARLAERAVAAIGPTTGYIGVDLLLGDSADQDDVIEINPRLTTSYVGLRAAYPENLAAAWLTVLDGQQVTLSEPRSLAFRADGVILPREMLSA